MLDAFHIAVDLLAMVDALEAQVRDLAQPEEEFNPVHLNAWGQTDPDPACPRCGGHGWYSKEIAGTNEMEVAVAYYNCPLCDPLGKIPFPIIPDATRAADPTQP